MARILAIDDELDMLTLIKNILIKGDHIVDIYQTTVDIDENSLGKYDLILLDVMMPEVDGISYCKNIRSKVDCLFNCKSNGNGYSRWLIKWRR